LIVPVAAVAEIVAVSRMLEVFKSAFDEVPAKVCKPVNVCAAFVTTMFALYAWTFVPIATPRFVLTVDAVAVSSDKLFEVSRYAAPDT